MGALRARCLIEVKIGSVESGDPVHSEQVAGWMDRTLRQGG